MCKNRAMDEDGSQRLRGWKEVNGRVGGAACKNDDAQRPDGDIERVTKEESIVGKHLPVTTAAATAAGVTSGTASVATGILTCCGRSEAGWQVWASHCLCVCLDKCR